MPRVLLLVLVLFGSILLKERRGPKLHPVFFYTLMQINIPRTTLKKIGQEETVTLSFAHGKKRKISADDLFTK